MTRSAPQDDGRTGPGYPTAMRVMHWLTVALLLLAYPLAWSIDAASSVDEAHRLVMLHRSVGVTILLLTLVRFTWRQRSTIPPLPSDLPWWQRLAARANALGLYVLLVMQPLLGLAASWMHGDHIVILGGVELPTLLPLDRPLGRLLFWLHGWVATLILLLIGVHVAAALYHHFVRRDDVLSGMLGTRAARSTTPEALTERPQ
jgi:cytochrome b561